MIFNTFGYYLLFLIPAALLFRKASSTWQPWVCALFGGAFFIYFSMTEIGGAAGAACLLIFLWECFVSRFYRKGSYLCLFGILQSVLFLIVFKYWNFLTGLWWPASHNPLRWQGAFLPLGISFFTFEFIHFAADSYRGRAPAGQAGEYLAFILFFPTMVAGPIKRYQDFVPKLRAVSREWTVDWHRGVTRILVGLAKKFAIADLMSAYTHHLNYVDLSRADRAVLPFWLLAFAIKIYFDFSAYSDIAIGSARLFGIKVPENFDWPYGRTNISEFWRHWHISLTNWLFDYIFASLCGRRAKRPKAYANLLVTMLVSGIWHGAGLNFVVFGLIHGVLLVVHQLWKQMRGVRTAPPSIAGQFAGAVFTFTAVTLSFAFFAMDLKTALFFFHRLIWG